MLERAERITAVCAALAGAGPLAEPGVIEPGAIEPGMIEPGLIESALVAERELRAWLDASNAELVAAVPCLATALGEGAITAGHVDAVTRAATRLDEPVRAEFHERIGELTEMAENCTVDRFARAVRDLARSLERDGGMDRFERQRRATSLRTWVGQDGMWNVRGRYDPPTGVRLDAALRRAVEALFAEATPDTCPPDPVEKQAHLRALALARLMQGDAPSGGSGRPEFVMVVDTGIDIGVGTDTGSTAGQRGSEGDRARASPAAPSGGRCGACTPRAASRAAAAHDDRCKLHHVIWWRHGGRTDLDNLLPLCVHHHHKVHDDGWLLTLGSHRELTITFPDGSVRNTGPPSRRAA